MLQVLISRQALCHAATALVLLLPWHLASAGDGRAVYSTGEGIKLYLPGPGGQQIKTPAVASNPEATAGTLNTTVLLMEDFENVFPSGAWTTPVDATSGCTWAKTTARADSGTNSASPVAAGCSTPTDPVAGPLPANAQIFMAYGPFDLSDKTSAALNFRFAIQLEEGDVFNFGHINDPACVGSYTVSGISGGGLTWQDRTLDLSSQVGNTDVCIAFILQTDGVEALGAEAVFVDNVEIVVDNLDADLAMTLVDVSDGTYAPGDQVSVRSIVQNLGTETSDSYETRFFISPDSNVTTQDFFLGSLSNAGIAASAKDDFTTFFPLPANLPEADWFIGASIPNIDTNPDNNSNHDPTPITVSTQPEILIRPTTLKIFKPAPASLNAVESQQTTQQPGPQKTRAATPTISPANLQKFTRIAQKRGQVNLLVGIDTGFTPEGILSNRDIQRQRGDISTATDRLLADLRPYAGRLKNRFTSIPYIALQADEATLLYLSNSPLVSSINEDTLSHVTLENSNIVIGSPLAWAEGLDASGWTVAVLDTGVDKTHSWFGPGGSRVVSEACFGTVEAGVSESFCPTGAASSTDPGSGINCDPFFTDCDHGTHVAGIAAGNDGVGPGFGVARGANIIAIQVFSKFLTESDCHTDQAPCVLSATSDQIAALERVLELSTSMDIAAVNMSLGGERFFNQASCDSSEPAIKAIIDNLRSAGIATVIASGNDGKVDSISAPGCVSSAISVGATNNDDQIASFSNIYPEIHLLAPGVGIKSSVPGDVLGVKSGTSMATPHVTGAWAVMKQRSPDSSVDEILTALQNTASLVDDQRSSGIETNLKRINLDLALGQPRSTFGIFNPGFGPLTVSSISPEIPSAWISIEPPPPFEIQIRGLAVVRVTVDFDNAPAGTSTRRLLIESDDMDKTPFPDGVFIETTNQDTPMPEFVSIPTAGSAIDFGDVTISTSSAGMDVSVQNIGTADLLMECNLSGAQATRFSVINCPSKLAPAGLGNVSLKCAPDSEGIKSAFLHIITNDSDEGDVSFTLSCNGIPASPQEVIFADGFES